MKVSLNWLKDWIDFIENDIDKIANYLTDTVSEVENVIKMGQGLDKVVIGQIMQIDKHPNADNMQITKTNIGTEVLQIVCGAKNIQIGQKVPVALIGAILPSYFIIKLANKRGVESRGMICSEVELGLVNKTEGIMVLNDQATIGMPIIEYLGLNDTVLEIENTTITNRPDLFSQVGYAREFTALNLAKWKKSPDENIVVPVNKKPFPININITTPDLVHRYCAVTITNFQVAESPNWMQNRLKACGIRPINNLVDITNYVMLERGIPLHAFDLTSIAGNKITMRLSKAEEKVITLDGITRKLGADIIILEDEEKIFDLCGIMGGANSEVKDSTSHVLLHAPVYDPVLIRRASVSLSHRTDASIMYEKRVPNAVALVGLKRAMELMLQLCPTCQIDSEILDIENTPTENRILLLPKSHLVRVFGQNIDDTFVINGLQDLGFKVLISNNVYQITVPAFRFKDINIPEDLIEEVIRLYGLQKIELELPKIDMSLAKPVNGFAIEKTAKNFLARSVYEVLNYSFLGDKLLKKCSLEASNLIEVKNFLSEEQRFMRTSLLPYLLQNIEHNYRQADKLSFFEIGKVFTINLINNHKTIIETKNLACISYNSSFLELKGNLELLLTELNLNAQIKPASLIPDYMHPGQIADIFFHGEKIGILGTIHPLIVNNFGLISSVVYYELNFDKLQSHKAKISQFKEINKLPTIIRDQNFILDQKVLASDFIHKISKNINYLQNLTITDVYEGDNIPVGKKCITIKVVYQADDKTLTDNEVELSHQEVVNLAIKNGASLR